MKSFAVLRKFAARIALACAVGAAAITACAAQTLIPIGEMGSHGKRCGFRELPGLTLIRVQEQKAEGAVHIIKATSGPDYTNELEIAFAPETPQNRAGLIAANLAVVELRFKLPLRDQKATKISSFRLLIDGRDSVVTQMQTSTLFGYAGMGIADPAQRVTVLRELAAASKVTAIAQDETGKVIAQQDFSLATLNPALAALRATQFRCEFKGEVRAERLRGLTEVLQYRFRQARFEVEQGETRGAVAQVGLQGCQVYLQLADGNMLPVRATPVAYLGNGDYAYLKFGDAPGLLLFEAGTQAAALGPRKPRPASDNPLSMFGMGGGGPHGSVKRMSELIATLRDFAEVCG